MILSSPIALNIAIDHQIYNPASPLFPELSDSYVKYTLDKSTGMSSRHLELNISKIERPIFLLQTSVYLSLLQLSKRLFWVFTVAQVQNLRIIFDSCFPDTYIREVISVLPLKYNPNAFTYVDSSPA